MYALERKLAGEALAQVFGWQLLQIGLWGDDDGLIAEARTQRKSVLAWHGARPPARHRPIRSRTDSLAIASDSVDAVLLPHTLEYEPEPHEILREVGRILSGEGHLIVLGFRPLSSWGLRHCSRKSGFPPGIERLIGEGRLRDWLKLLGFEIVDARRYLFTLAVRRAARRRRRRFFERSGNYLWPMFAGGYLIKARKRVYTLTPIRPRWRLRPKVVGGLIEPTHARQREAHVIRLSTRMNGRSRDLHGRCLPRKSGAGRLGRVLRSGEHEKELKGAEPLTTNNRMELTAAIRALAALKRGCTSRCTPTRSTSAKASSSGCRNGSCATGALPTRSR